VAQLARVRRPRLVPQALAALQDWTALARVPELSADAPDLARWGARALRAGYTTSAVQLADAALAIDPAHSGAQAVRTNGQDQLDVVRFGWRPVPLGRTPYEPAERAVLSVLSQSLPIRSGGYATRTHGVLTGLVARGWDVQAVTRLGFPYDRWPLADRRTVPAFDDVDGIRYHRLLREGARRYPQYPLADYVTAMAAGVERIACQHRARLVHASSFYVTGLAAAQAARRLGLPFLYEMRGLEDLMKSVQDPDFHSTDRYRFLDLVETEVCHEADAVFVITRALRDEMARRGVAEDKLVVLPNGVHTDQFAPRERDRELEQRLGVEGFPVIGYAGSLVDYEGLELLMSAAAILRDRDVRFRVVVVGDGPAEASVRAATIALGLGELVTFTGRVPHDEVGRYLSLFDITPFPRLPLEVCELISPMKPFEALAMGKAVVVSSVAALTEIVQDGRTGLIFTKGDDADLARALQSLLEAPELRARLGEEGLRWVRAERDWSTVTEVADATYRDVLTRRGAAPRGPGGGDAMPSP
jgi:glycosyltransferase involved in cell wall biosynthesis